jgi:hypothetical protein
MEYPPRTGFHYCKLLTHLVCDYGSFINVSSMVLDDMHMGKFLNYLGVRNIFDTKLHGLGTCLCLAGCLFHCII